MNNSFVMFFHRSQVWIILYKVVDITRAVIGRCPRSHFHKHHNAPCSPHSPPPPRHKFCIIIVFNFFWVSKLPQEIEHNGYIIFFFGGWEGGKVHYGLCENGELKYRDMNEGKNISDTLVVLTTHILTSSVIYYWTDARQHGICLLIWKLAYRKVDDILERAWNHHPRHVE